MFVIDFYISELCSFYFPNSDAYRGKNSFCVAEIQQFFQTTGF